MNPVGTTYHLRLKLWENAFEFHANEFSLGGPLCAPLDPEGLLTFGQEAFQVHQRSDSSSGEISLGNVRVRRLTQPQIPAPSVPREEHITYWQQRHAGDPGDLLAMRELARLLLHSAPERALELARSVHERQPQMNYIHGIMARVLYTLGRPDEGSQELELAEKVPSLEGDLTIARIEQYLAHPDPESRKYEMAKFHVSLLEHEEEPVLWKSYAARLAFSQKEYRQAVDLNQEAINLATGAQADALKAWHEKYQAALAEQTEATDPPAQTTQPPTP